MSEILDLTAVHEAAHAAAAWALDLPLAFVTAASAVPGFLGRCYFEPPSLWFAGDEATAYDVAVAALAGELAEQAYGRGGDFMRSLRVDWSSQNPDTDLARRLIAVNEPERERLMRGVVAARSRGVLMTRWRAVLALARELERRGSVFGHDVDRICITTGARTYAQIGGTR